MDDGWSHDAIAWRTSRDSQRARGSLRIGKWHRMSIAHTKATLHTAGKQSRASYQERNATVVNSRTKSNCRSVGKFNERQIHPKAKQKNNFQLISRRNSTAPSTIVVHVASSNRTPLRKKTQTVAGKVTLFVAPDGPSWKKAETLHTALLPKKR